MLQRRRLAIRSGERTPLACRIWRLAKRCLLRALLVRTGCLGSDAFQVHATHRVDSTEAFLRVENLEP